MAPVRMFLTFKRSSALPRPIFCCSYERIWTICPSSSIIAPRLRSLVEITLCSLLRLLRGENSGICDDERLRRVAQHARAGFLEHDKILDSHAAPTRQVDARLDGKHHAWSKHVVATRLGQRRWFVDLEP